MSSLGEYVIKFVSLIVALNMMQSGPRVTLNDNFVNSTRLAIALMIAPMMAPMTA